MRAVVVEDISPRCPLQTLCESVHGNVNHGAPSLRLSPLVGMEGYQLDLRTALNDMLRARAIAGQDGTVEGDDSLWPWVSLVESGFVKVLSTGDSDISRRLC